MSTLDLHAYTSEGATHVAAIHRGPGDESPLQMISAERLAQLLVAEAELLAIQKRLGNFLHGAPLG